MKLYHIILYEGPGCPWILASVVGGHTGGGLSRTNPQIPRADCTIWTFPQLYCTSTCLNAQKLTSLGVQWFKTLPSNVGVRSIPAVAKSTVLQPKHQNINRNNIVIYLIKTLKMVHIKKTMPRSHRYLPTSAVPVIIIDTMKSFWTLL